MNTHVVKDLANSSRRSDVVLESEGHDDHVEEEPADIVDELVALVKFSGQVMPDELKKKIKFKIGQKCSSNWNLRFRSRIEESQRRFLSPTSRESRTKRQGRRSTSRPSRLGCHQSSSR